jgi:hypothetical protein
MGSDSQEIDGMIDSARHLSIWDIGAAKLNIMSSINQTGVSSLL